MPNVGDIVRASDLEANKPQLSIGTVTTGAAGTNASASITGTSPNFKLNLTIPRGNTGATGATGPQGPSGTYTGPLKPTSSYWRLLEHRGTTTTPATLPSGGTWAYVTIYQFYFYKVGVAAGGTVVDNVLTAMNHGFCWRIQ